MPDGTVMDGPIHGPGQICVEWGDKKFKKGGRIRNPKQKGRNKSKPLAKHYSAGGYLVGPSHDNGGIQAIVDNTEPIEVEGGEFIINKQTVDAVGEDFLHKLNSTETTHHTGGFNEGQLPSPSNFKDGGQVGGKNMKKRANRKPARRIDEKPVNEDPTPSYPACLASAEHMGGHWGSGGQWYGPIPAGCEEFFNPNMKFAGGGNTKNIGVQTTNRRSNMARGGRTLQRRGKAPAKRMARGGRPGARKMASGGSNCGPGMMYSNGGCAPKSSYKSGGRTQPVKSRGGNHRRYSTGGPSPDGTQHGCSYNYSTGTCG